MRSRPHAVDQVRWDMPMWVKICGIRDVSTARAVADLAPDAIGLNFHPASPRCVDVRMAERIVRALPAAIEPVGVFVNRPVAEIIEIAAHCRISTIQLHGDEPADEAQRLQAAGLAVIRAIRVAESDLSTVAQAVEAHRNVSLHSLLIDSRTVGTYGGSGTVAPWKGIADLWQTDWPRLILAGGLTPANVGEAISTTRPGGVDTASGVESAPGIKDLALTRAFLTMARSARPAAAR